MKDSAATKATEWMRVFDKAFERMEPIIEARIDDIVRKHLHLAVARHVTEEVVDSAIRQVASEARESVLVHLRKAAGRA